eukprot:scaffold37412_cov30-Tisochrysis_lutea.AAC.3
MGGKALRPLLSVSLSGLANLLWCLVWSGGVLASVCAAFWVRFGPWLASTWVGLALAGGCCVCAASAITWSAGAAGWAERGEGSGSRSMTHRPCHYNDSCDACKQNQDDFLPLLIHQKGSLERLEGTDDELFFLIA